MAGSVLAFVCCATSPPVLAQIGWAQQAAGFASNGAIAVKGVAGGSYASTVNPAGAVAKANQNSVTQPPTVIVQATSGSFFNYATDCFVLFGPTGGNAIGIGKLVTPTSFTGLAAQFAASSSFIGAMSLIAMATAGPNGTQPTFGGIASSFNSLAAAGSAVLMAQSMPIASAIKCYP